MRFPVRFPTNQVPSEMDSTRKEKNLLPRGANSFLLEQTPFQKYDIQILSEWPPLQMYQMKGPEVHICGKGSCT